MTVETVETSILNVQESTFIWAFSSAAAVSRGGHTFLLSPSFTYSNELEMCQNTYSILEWADTAWIHLETSRKQAGTSLEFKIRRQETEWLERLKKKLIWRRRDGGISFFQEEEEIIRHVKKEGTREEDNTWRNTETIYVKLNTDPIWLKYTEQTHPDTDMTVDAACMFSVRLARLDTQIWLKLIRFYRDHTETAFFSQDHRPNVLQNEALPPRSFTPPPSICSSRILCIYRKMKSTP